MYAHVTTNHLSNREEVDAALDLYYTLGASIRDQDARRLANLWCNAFESEQGTSLELLALGKPFDTDDLQDDIRVIVADSEERDAFLDWLDGLEELLCS